MCEDLNKQGGPCQKEIRWNNKCDVHFSKELTVPKYNFDNHKIVIGHGNQSYKKQKGTQNCRIDKTIVDKKLALWDHVKKNNLLTSPATNVRNQALRLLKDKTIFAYAYLKFDDKPLRLQYYQDAIISDNHDRILFCGSNQLGKSFTLNVDAATSFMKDHGKNWVGILVSGSLPQSQYQMDRIKQLLKGGRINYKVEDTTESKTGKKDNTTQISYTFYDKNQKPLYRNLLICCPHTSSALGYPADEVWIDEWDFWDNCDQEHFLYQIIIPRTFQTKGKIKIYSNPNGKEKMMYKLWNTVDGEGNPAWHRYQFNYWDSENASQEDFNKKITGMTKTRIESTLLAIFTRTEGSFFSTDEIQDMLDPELTQKGDQAGYGKETAWFLDVGSVHDQSVLIGGYIEPNPTEPDIPLIKVFWIHKYPVGYPISRVVGIKLNSMQDEDGWEDYSDENPSVKQVLDEYSEVMGKTKYQPLFGFDATGSAGLKPLMQAADIEAADITFTGKLKWHMYQRYQYYVQQRFIKRTKERDENTVRGCDFDYQASKLVVKKNTNTVYKQIHHENEDDLDDTQDAMAGFIHLIENPDLPSLSFDLVKHKQVTGEGVPKKEEIDENGQYIPSFYDKQEFSSWKRNRELT